MLFGPGLLGLRALVTGVPVGLLRAPHTAMAQRRAALAPQFVLFSTSGQGDPLNANAPGTYDDPNIFHASDPSMAATPLTVGAQQTTAAQIWSTLPASMLQNFCFFHHASNFNAHPQELNVLKLGGAVKSGDMLPSMLASQLGQSLGSVRSTPINFNLGGLEALSAQGVLQPAFTPQGLANSLSVPGNALGDMNFVALRDKSIDALHAWARERGTSFQASFLDQYALSQNQVRTIQDRVVAQLSGITGDDPVSQIRAALVLFQMNIAPVVMMQIGFGGDNHSDTAYVNGVRTPLMGSEVPQHKVGVGYLAQLPTLVAQAGLTEQVTFCLTNVFGRTLSSRYNGNGRDHNQNHAVSLLWGPQVQGGVVGGVQANSTDYQASPIDSSTGAANANGDIGLSAGAGSFGKTLCAVAGLGAEVYDAQISQGTAVASVVGS